jgi:hypothetical protein
LANGIVARLLRAPIGIFQGLVSVLLSLALTAAVLGAIAPISLSLVVCWPSSLGMSSRALTAELAKGDPHGLWSGGVPRLTAYP